MFPPFIKVLFESKYCLWEKMITWVLGIAFIQQCAFVYIYEGLTFLNMSHFAGTQRSPQSVPGGVTSPLFMTTLSNLRNNVYRICFQKFLTNRRRILFLLAWEKGMLLMDPCQIFQKLHLLTFEISVAGQIWFQQCVKSTKYKRLIRIIYLSNSFWDLPI